MFTIAGIGFATPWLLGALLALPILWILLRAVPPAPIRRRFPGVALLLGLMDDETQTDKTPWWLLLLRMLAVAAMIIGFAGPVLNPKDETAGTGPLLILIDGTWADARDWARRMDRVEALLDEARADGRTVALAQLTDLPAGALQFQAADVWSARLASLAPQAWAPDPVKVGDWIDTLEGGFDTFWLSDGLDRETREPALAALEDRGSVSVFEAVRVTYGLRPPAFVDGNIALTAVRSA
ncbi:MAG: BatA domain-containing protein, partial [Pseudomonadota bacterium]